MKKMCLLHCNIFLNQAYCFKRPATLKEFEHSPLRLNLKWAQKPAHLRIHVPLAFRPLTQWTISMVVMATGTASPVEQDIMPQTLDKRCAQNALLENTAQEIHSLVQQEIVLRERIPQVELRPLLARAVILPVLLPHAGSVRQGVTPQEDQLFRVATRVLGVTLVAIAKRDDTPQVVQPTRCAALLKAALVLQLASAKLEDGQPGVRRVSIA